MADASKKQKMKIKVKADKYDDDDEGDLIFTSQHDDGVKSVSDHGGGDGSAGASEEEIRRWFGEGSRHEEEK